MNIVQTSSVFEDVVLNDIITLMSKACLRNLAKEGDWNCLYELSATNFCSVMSLMLLHVTIVTARCDLPGYGGYGYLMYLKLT